MLETRCFFEAVYNTYMYIHSATSINCLLFTDLAKAQLEDLDTGFEGLESTLTRPDNFL